MLKPLGSVNFFKIGVNIYLILCTGFSLSEQFTLGANKPKDDETFGLLFRFIRLINEKDGIVQ